MSDLFEKVNPSEFREEANRQTLNEQRIKSMRNIKENWVYLQDAVWDLFRHSPNLTEKDRKVLELVDDICLEQRARCNRDGGKSM